MASFSLRSQRTGQYKSFTLLEVLKLLGDRVNDEIWLEDGEDVYNMSSFQELGGGDGSSGATTPMYWSVETPSNTSNQQIFYLQFTPTSKNSLLLVILNGMVQTQNRDFFLDGKQISFSFPLNSADSAKFIYQYE